MYHIKIIILQMPYTWMRWLWTRYRQILITQKVKHFNYTISVDT